MRLIDADEFLLTTKVGCALASMCTTNVAKKEILKATYEFIKERIGDTPTVDAVLVRHGKWVTGKYNDELSVPCCSECNAFVTLSPYGLNYCPNCGAKMDGGDRNELDRR